MTAPTWNSAAWQRLSSLFEEALELGPKARAALLAQVGANEPLIAQTLLRMLALDAGFATHTPPSPAVLVNAVMDPALPAGSLLGSYAIDACVGVGGMGRVYKAHRVEGDVSQTVAIKCLRFPDRDPEFMRRFLRERQILAALNHPHIARFLDTGTDVKGQPFVALEYVDGIAITEFAAAQKYSLTQRIALLLKVMDAVAYSHRQLIIHRDIKPSNVLVDTQGEPHLLDFGIAKPIAAIAGIHTGNETAIEQRAYSIGYAAPEQLRGTAVGTAADIYALGVLSYELLCAQPPLALVDLSFVEAQQQVLETFPEPPSERINQNAEAPDGTDGKVWQRALRGDLDNIVLHALKKAPGERYATVDALMDDLRRTRNNEPISLRGSHRWYRAQKFVSRHRLAVGLAASLLIALGAGGIALWRQKAATEMQRDAAVAQSRRAEAQTRRAEALNNLLLDAFEAADPSRNRGNEVTAREVLDQAARRVDDERMDAATRVALLTTVADVYRTLGLSAESAKAAENATRLSGDIPPLLKARAWRALAEAKLALGNVVAAEAALQMAKQSTLDLGERSASAETYEQEYVALKALIGRGRAPETLDRFAELYARAKKQFGNSDELTIRCGTAYAEQLRILNRPKDGAPIVDELLENFADPGLDPIGVRLLSDKALSERVQLRPLQAKTFALQHIEGVRLLYGERHAHYAKALELLGKLEQDEGRYDRAIDLLNQGLQVLNALSSQRESASQALALNNLANLLRKAGRLEEAKSTAIKAVNMAVKTTSPSHTNTATFRTTLAEILIERHEFSDALEELDQTEIAFAALQTTHSPGVVRASGQILRGEALLGLGRIREAELALNQGWLKISTLEPNNWRYQQAQRLRQRLTETRAPISSTNTN